MHRSAARVHGPRPIVGVAVAMVAAGLFGLNGTVSKIALGAGLSSLRRGAALPHACPVELLAFVVSPGHNYYFHGPVSGGVGPHPTSYPDTIELIAGQGVVGDRFYGKAGSMKAAVSFVAAEAVEAVSAALGAEPSLDARLTRRTIVVRGMDLNALRHQHFALEQDGVQVRFAGGRETSPCAWMDAVLAPGARDLLRGRGGLRASPLLDGRLRLGPALLHSGVPVDPARAGTADRRRAALP